MHAIVVGSGPAATACTLALLRRGVSVSILDAGETLERDRQDVVDILRETPPYSWDRAKVRWITENPSIKGSKVPTKLLFGSDFVYWRDHPLCRTKSDSEVRFTFAKGGFSTVWAGSVLPADDCDMTDWPIKRSDLHRSYRSVLRELPLSAKHDALEADFPLYKDDPVPLRSERAATLLETDLAKAKKASVFREFVHGQARLLVRAGEFENGTCIYCGLCLSGCPRGAIYGTKPTINDLTSRHRVRSISSVIVNEVVERKGKVEVRYDRLDGSGRFSEECDKVFIAAGPINTTRIALQSLKKFNQSVTLKTSQKFIVPLLRFRGSALQWPDLNTLPSIFIETKLNEQPEHWIHIQISLVNDFILKRLRIDPFNEPLRVPLFLRSLIRRLMIGWCSLHSDVSSSFEVRLSAGDATTPTGILELREISNSNSATTARKVAWALTRSGVDFGCLFLAPLLRLAAAGGGNHLGGSFPMRSSAAQSGLSTDILGRPYGCTRIHLVDSSVFPSIPGTTIGLLTMANADRIATDSPLY